MTRTTPDRQATADFTDVPEELKSRHQWVNWVWAERVDKATGEITYTKEPVRPGLPKRFASSTTPATWATFDACVASVPPHDGIGFVFSKEDDYFGVDLDNCRDPKTGEIDQWALDWIDMFSTYTEVSPSLTGVKLIGWGRLSTDKGCKRPHVGPNGRMCAVERYDHGRFFTITGQVVPGCPLEIRDCNDDALRALEAAYPKPEKEGREVETRPVQPVSLDDAALLDLARRSRSGSDFADLYDRGVWRGGKDHSGADLALCNRLAFWTGRDAARMDRLFRASALMRDKWEREDYRASTMGLAIRGCRDPYTAPRAKTEAQSAVHGRNGSEPEPITEQPRRSLSDAIETFRKWLYLEDDGHIKVALGAYAANRMQGPPVWLMLIGGPSSGKTEAIASMSLLPHLQSESSLSGEAALLSGTAKKDKSASATGGILHKLGKFGVLVLKDFTSILSMKHENRAALLAALREVYDGSWTRSVGVDGGRTLSWSGKAGMIACCTPIIDSHHAVIGAMGERFLFYRLPVADAASQADASLDLFGREGEMRKEMTEVVSAVFSGLSLEKPADPISVEERVTLIALAVLSVRCRSAVERDRHTREILLVPDAEAPSRMAGALFGLFHGMCAIGVTRDEAWGLLAKVATDCIPALRWRSFLHIAECPFGASTTQVAVDLCHPTSTVRRALEDLNAHGILERRKQGVSEISSDLWLLTEWARNQYDTVKPCLLTSRACTGVVPAKSSLSNGKNKEGRRVSREGDCGNDACTGTEASIELAAERDHVEDWR